MTNEQYFQEGYDDFWEARYNPPQGLEAEASYMDGYNQAEYDIATGNY